jgi:hypothetical protein
VRQCHPVLNTTQGGHMLYIALFYILLILPLAISARSR